MRSLKPTARFLGPGCQAGCVGPGLVLRQGGKLDLPGYGHDLGCTGLALVTGQDRVDFIAELESYCLFGLAAFGVVSLDFYSEGDGFHWASSSARRSTPAKHPFRSAAISWAVLTQNWRMVLRGSRSSLHRAGCVESCT